MFTNASNPTTAMVLIRKADYYQAARDLLRVFLFSVVNWVIVAEFIMNSLTVEQFGTTAYELLHPETFSPIYFAYFAIYWIPVSTLLTIICKIELLCVFSQNPKGFHTLVTSTVPRAESTPFVKALAREKVVDLQEEFDHQFTVLASVFLFLAMSLFVGPFNTASKSILLNVIKTMFTAILHVATVFTKPLMLVRDLLSVVSEIATGFATVAILVGILESIAAVKKEEQLANLPNETCASDENSISGGDVTSVDDVLSLQGRLGASEARAKLRRELEELICYGTN